MNTDENGIAIIIRYMDTWKQFDRITDKVHVAQKLLKELQHEATKKAQDESSARVLDEGKLKGLWCQHCKAIQKSSDITIQCWMNPFDKTGYCASNEDAIKEILKLLSSAPIIKDVQEKTLSEAHRWLTENWKDLDSETATYWRSHLDEYFLKQPLDNAQDEPEAQGEGEG